LELSNTSGSSPATERTWDKWSGEDMYSGEAREEEAAGEGEQATLTTAPAIIIATPTI